jgi:hypothetical protein
MPALPFVVTEVVTEVVNEAVNETRRMMWSKCGGATMSGMPVSVL